MIKSSPFRSDFGLAGNFDPDEYILNQQGCLRVPAEYCSILMHRDGHAHDPHFPSWIKRQRGSIHRCLASGVIVRFGEKKHIVTNIEVHGLLHSHVRPVQVVVHFVSRFLNLV